MIVAVTVLLINKAIESSHMLDSARCHPWPNLVYDRHPIGLQGKIMVWQFNVLIQNLPLIASCRKDLQLDYVTTSLYEWSTEYDTQRAKIE